MMPPEIVTARPPCAPVTEAVAVVGVAGTQLTAELPEKQEEFRQIVKRLQMRVTWMGRRCIWVRDVPESVPADRAAELVRALLTAGFVVRAEAGIIQAAASGAFQTEPRRWVTAARGDYEGWFRLGWFRDQDCYNLARTLPGARYDSPCVVVPAEHYEAVLDFARLYGFAVTPAAVELADSAHTRREAIITIELSPMPAAPLPEMPALLPTGKPRKLEPPDDVEVPAELLDL